MIKLLFATNVISFPKVHDADVHQHFAYLFSDTP